ncbi:Hypothetical predicted protein [Paramuricea clavata]|uniref:Uncharacterized protein n=1 Tax=Paramuricea clavata TaxID=317549 RepID=A0A7D9IGD4_PARCT|nr:Hypothetical predicted protein [Paramuricea clavata]
MKLERMKLPQFSGNIRDYPRFRSDFEKQILPELESGKVAYVLKSCLEGEAFDAIYNLDDDNIKHLQEGDDKSFLELINTVEKGYQDLARINMESEISNSGTVSLIEERLPRDIKREWSREVNRSTSKVEQKNKFPYLLQFLQEQRKIIEYESSELKTGEDHARKGRVHMIDRDGKFIEDKEATKTTRCLVHSSSTHNTADCRVYQEMAPEGKVQLLKDELAGHASRLVTALLTADNARNASVMIVQNITMIPYT